MKKTWVSTGICMLVLLVGTFWLWDRFWCRLSGFGTVEEQIDRMFQYAPSARFPPAASVLVAKGGRVLFCKSYGCKDVETGEKADPHTCYRLASITKTFTAMAVMMLKERGLLAYDDPVSKYLPDFPAYGAKVTLRHLLTHRSGLRDYYEYYPMRGTPQLTDRTAYELLKKAKGLKFEPGEKGDYVDVNYAALALVVEKVSGMSFADFLRQKIFEPAGMKSAVAFVEGRDTIENRAYGAMPEWFRYETLWDWRNWYKNKDTNYVKRDQYAYSAVLGDGGVYASVYDMLAWDRALAANTLVSAATLQEAITPATDMPGFDPPVAYGFGWFLSKFKGYGPRMVHHSGGTIGFGHNFIRVPEKDLVVVVLTNNAYYLAWDMSEKILGFYLNDSL